MILPSNTGTTGPAVRKLSTGTDNVGKAAWAQIPEVPTKVVCDLKRPTDKVQLPGPTLKYRKYRPNCSQPLIPEVPVASSSLKYALPSRRA